MTKKRKDIKGPLSLRFEICIYFKQKRLIIGRNTLYMEKEQVFKKTHIWLVFTFHSYRIELYVGALKKNE